MQEVTSERWTSDQLNTFFDHICHHFCVGATGATANPPKSDDKYVEKSVQLVRGSSFRNDLLQNPYFSKKNWWEKQIYYNQVSMYLQVDFEVIKAKLSKFFSWMDSVASSKTSMSLLLNWWIVIRICQIQISICLSSFLQINYMSFRKKNDPSF